MSTKIEWAEESWNPITGCTPISEGCANCYAKRMAQRLKGRFGYPEDDPFRVTFHPDKLNQPLKWKKPRMIFVCSMGDICHKDVKPIWLDDILSIMFRAQHHFYLILTKRPNILLAKHQPWIEHAWGGWPSCAWLGVTAENQQRADERIPILLQIPAAKRFVSVEPMLGPVDLDKTCPGKPINNGWCWREGIDWVILGGESGPGARPMHPHWVRSVRDQCQKAGVPFFFKQWGEWTGDKGWYLHEDMESCKNMIVDRNGKDKIGISMGKVGKKKAGRLLDGKEWNERPN